MGLNKKGIIFSIISLMISILIITIYSLAFNTDFESEVAQVNSRAELMDINFNIIESNINSIISISSRKTLSNLAEASYNFYDNNTNTPFEMDAVCEFNNLMKGNNMRVFEENENTTDILFEITGTYEANSCSGLVTNQQFNSELAYVQKFIPENQIYSRYLELGLNGTAGDIVSIYILDSCKSEVAKYVGPIINSGTGCGTETYELDKAVEFKKDEKYYIYVKGPSSSYIKVRSGIHDLNNRFEVNTSVENVTQSNYGFNPKLNNTVIDYLNEVSVFLNKTYKSNSSYELKDINLRQENSWKVIVEGTVIIRMQDSFFKINKNIPFEVEVDIEGLPDPMFSKFRENRLIIREKPVSESKLNFTYLITLVENKTYFRDTKSPSYLDRFSSEENSSNCCGIQTFFDPRTLPSPYISSEHNALTNNTISAWRLLNKADLCAGNESELFTYNYEYWSDDIYIDDVNRAKFNITLGQSTELHYQWGGDACS